MIMVNANSRNAAGYARRSTDRQEQSIGDQRRAVEQYAEANDFRMVDWYVDDAISGASADARDAFLRMIEDARQADRPFRYVLVYDIKRFGRLDNDETGHYRYLLAQAGVEVVYVSENFNGDDTDDLLRPVKQWQARQELKDLSKVTLRGLLTRSEGGWWMGGQPPFGYDLAYFDGAGKFLMTVRFTPGGGKQVLDQNGEVVRTLEKGNRVMVAKEDRARLVLSSPDRVETVQRIFSLYVDSGVGFKGIADRFNHEGIPGPGRTSTTWAMTTVRDIILNPTYTGDATWNRRSMAKFHSVERKRAVVRPKVGRRAVEHHDRSDWIVTKDSHAAIIPRAVFEKATQERKGRQRARPNSYRLGRGATSGFLLSGLIVCAHCGHNWQGYTQQKRDPRQDGSKIKTRYYACGGYITKGTSVCKRSIIRKEAIEELVLDEIGRNLRAFADGDVGRKMLKKALDELCGTRSDSSKERQKLLVHRAEIEQKIYNIIDNLTSVTREFADKRVSELKAELDRIGARLEELDTVPVASGDINKLLPEFIGYLDSFREVAATGTVEEKRLLVRAFTHRVELDPEKGVGTAQMYLLPKNTALPAKANNAANLLLSLVAGAGFEPATSGL